MKKEKIIAVSAVLLIMATFVCACGSKSAKVNTETEYNNPIDYNPIGQDYNTIVDYLEENKLVYGRMVSNYGNNFIVYFEKSDDRDTDPMSKSLYFTDDNLCLKWQWVYPVKKYTAVLDWLNQNFAKHPTNSLTWEQLNLKLTYHLEINEIELGLFGLYCIADTYEELTEAPNGKLILDFSNVYRFDHEKKEWKIISNGEWSTFDEVAGEMFNTTFSTNRFVIPNDLEGKIEHFGARGKMRTYEIIYLLDVRDDLILLIVEDEEEEEFCFVVHVDLLNVAFRYDDSTMILFTDE